MSNKSLGNSFEREFATILYNYGWWVHLLQQNQAGQPADLIAVRHGSAILVDCKVCSGDRFPLSRVEDNQDMAMTLWYDCGNGSAWFALKTPSGKVYMIPHIRLHDMIARNQSSIAVKDLPQLATPLERWLSQRR